jgi:hypothetical protein
MNPPEGGVRQTTKPRVSHREFDLIGRSGQHNCDEGSQVEILTTLARVCSSTTR